MLSKTPLPNRVPRQKAVFYELTEMLKHNHNSQSEIILWENSLSAYSHNIMAEISQLVVANSYSFCTMGGRCD